MEENDKCHIKEHSKEGEIHSLFGTSVVTIKETFMKGSHCEKVLEEWMEFFVFGHLETWKKHCVRLRPWIKTQRRGNVEDRIYGPSDGGEGQGHWVRSWASRFKWSKHSNKKAKTEALIPPQKGQWCSSHALSKGLNNSRKEAYGHSSAVHLASLRRQSPITFLGSES